MPVLLAILSVAACIYVSIAWWNSLEIGILLSALVLGIQLIIVLILCHRDNLKLDQPQTYSFDIPPTVAFSELKQTLRELYFREKRWKITVVDREHLSLQAFVQYKDYSWKDNPFATWAQEEDGSIFRQIVLFVDVSVDSQTGKAVVRLQYDVESPVIRGDLWTIQVETTDQIRAALEARETSMTSDPDDATNTTETSEEQDPVKEYQT